jgi:hypothetical protein
LITALREITADETNMLICTDEELFFLLNDCISPEDRVSYRTFQRYKQKALKYFGGEEELPEDIDPMYEQFYSIIRRATLTMKRNLMKNMMEADKNDWMRYKWVMERKFVDFRIEKSPPPVPEPIEPPKIRITTPPLPNWMATAIAEDQIREEKERSEAMIAAEKARLLAEMAKNPVPSNQQAGGLGIADTGGTPAAETVPPRAPRWQDIDKNLKNESGLPMWLIMKKEEEERLKREQFMNPDRPRSAGQILGCYSL